MVIVGLAGGLGNQLFQYAAGRRLALKNNVPLKLDNISWFPRDFYQREYSLKYFSIVENFADRGNCFPGLLGKYKRKLLRKSNQWIEFSRRRYIEESASAFDKRLFDLRVARKIYLKGYWQSEKYFKDIETELREDLRFREEHDAANIELAKKICDTEAVCVHVRRLLGVRNHEDPLDPSHTKSNFVCDEYYKHAIDRILSKVDRPHVFVFSDYPSWAKENIKVDCPVTFVTNNDGTKDYEDMWLMSQCKHFIIANSTFSWWGAWLGGYAEKKVIVPSSGFANSVDMLPAEWEVM